MRITIWAMGMVLATTNIASASEFTCTFSSEGQKPFVIEVTGIDRATHKAMMSVNGGPFERADTKEVGGAYSLIASEGEDLLFIFHYLTIHSLNEKPSKAIYSVHAVANAASTTVGVGKTTLGTCTSRL
jgi:hypothetical protein